MTLPQEFLDTMHGMLGEEFTDYEKSLDEPSRTAIRVNTNKITIEEFLKISPFALEQIPWTAKGFYYDEKETFPAKHPYYYAGLYYIQEPSAMIPASLLPVREGDRLLDLCAAPGGKATELAAKLKNTGLLVANDISASRAMALAKNLQVAGAKNALVTAEAPEKLAGQLPEYFDGVLVDAPCSGEGMFRRDPHMIEDWKVHGPVYYARLQREILASAYQMLRPGGYLVYSTCTFSPKEDEQIAEWLVQEYPDMKICPVSRCPGYSEGRPEWGKERMDSLRHCVRIFPHRAEGEGHFAVLLRKEGELVKQEASSREQELPGQKQTVSHEEKTPSNRRQTVSYQEKTVSSRKQTTSHKEKSGEEVTKKKRTDDQADAECSAYFENLKKSMNMEPKISGNAGARLLLSEKKNTCTAVCPEMQEFDGLRRIMSGVILGEKKKNRFEPSPQLALALRPEAYPEVIDLPSSDERVIRYLKGETVSVSESGKGYLLFCTDGFPLGWCKGNGNGMLKNKYHPGWRYLS